MSNTSDPVLDRIEPMLRSPEPLPGRSQTAASSVARLLSFCFVVAATLMVLHFAITLGLRRVRTSDFGVSNRIVQGQINADIVITGSSRALTHYDPRIITASTGRTAYNLGRNGSQTDLQVAVLKMYLAHNAKPKVIIHNLDLYSFETSHEIYDPAQYVPYLNEHPIYDAVRRVYPEVWKWKYIPLYGYAAIDMRFEWTTGLMRWLGIERAEDHFDGFVPRHSAWTGDFERFASEHPHGIRTPIERQGIADLRDLLSLCRHEGIPLILVYSPEFSGVQSLEINRDAIFARFKALASEFAIPFWDFSGSAIARHSENFYNSQHLNAEGAAKFSRDLALRLESSGMPVLQAEVSSRLLKNRRF